jgi:hypothetical protein
MKKENLLGQKFNRLLVIAEADPISKRVAWLCKCDCENEKAIKAEELKSGGTKSCGCLNNEKRSQRSHKLYAANIKYSPQITTARRVWKKRYNDGILFEDFLRLSQMDCYYCGTKPNNKQNSAKSDKKASQFAKDNGDFIYNGLDRIDSNLPHLLENCVPCCKWCNYAKSDMTTSEFQQWLKRISANYLFGMSEDELDEMVRMWKVKLER